MKRIQRISPQFNVSEALKLLQTKPCFCTFNNTLICSSISQISFVQTQADQFSGESNTVDHCGRLRESQTLSQRDKRVLLSKSYDRQLRDFLCITAVSNDFFTKPTQTTNCIYEIRRKKILHKRKKKHKIVII